MEVMTATFILCVGLVSALGHYADLQSSRRATTQYARVQDIVRNLAERAEASDPNLLGKRAAPWSHARFQDLLTYPDGQKHDHAPMCDDPARPDCDLVTLGVVDRPTGIPGLQIFFEYYQGTSATLLNGATAKPGVLDLQFKDINGAPVPMEPGVFRSMFDGDLFENSADFRKARRLEPGPAFMTVRGLPVLVVADGEMDLTTQVAEDDIFVIHIVAVWDGGHFDVFAGKKRTPP
jgi:hypothetical protein